MVLVAAAYRRRGIADAAAATLHRQICGAGLRAGARCDAGRRGSIRRLGFRDALARSTRWRRDRRDAGGPAASVRVRCDDADWPALRARCARLRRRPRALLERLRGACRAASPALDRGACAASCSDATAASAHPARAAGGRGRSGGDRALRRAATRVSPARCSSTCSTAHRALRGLARRARLCAASGLTRAWRWRATSALRRAAPH